MRLSPSRPLNVCLIALCLTLVGLARPALAQEQLEGTLLVAWADPHPTLGGASDVRYTLALPDGRMVPLDVVGLEAQAIASFGHRVALTGRQRSAAPRAADGVAPVAAPFAVNAIAPISEPAAALAAPEGVAFGTKKVVFVLAKFSDDAAVPHSTSFFTDLTNPLTPPGGATFPATINGFFSKTSWNQLAWSGDVAGVGGIGAPGGWMTLPHPKSYYANCGWSTSCFNFSALSADAVTLAKAQGVVFTNYDNINFVVSNDLDCCAWGGGYYLDGKSYGATWEPPWGQETGTYAHEMGHSIGLPHSGWVYYAYDSPWDMMSLRRSAATLSCGSYLSINNGGSNAGISCTEPGDGYISAHKDYLGWIPPANVLVTDTYSSSSVTIDGLSLALGAPLKMVKICLPTFSCTGGTARYLTVEARVKALGTSSQFDNGILNEGIIIHEVRMNRPAISGSCYFNSQSGWAVPVDSTPGDYNSTTCSSSGALTNAQFIAGQTYTNATYGVSVSVISRSGSTFVVSINSLSQEWIQNGSFAGGTANWQVYATPDSSYLTTSVSGGVLQFSRTPGPGGTANQGTVFQTTGVTVGASGAVAAQFDLGNTSTVRKRVTVLLLDSNFSDLAVCSFWLPPSAPLRTFQMRAHSTSAWTNAAIYFYAATANVNGDTGVYQVDNVSVHAGQSQSTARTDCIDPVTPSAPGGASSTNLLTNGDFASGVVAPWFLYGQITSRISAGVFEFVRTVDSPAGVIVQSTGHAVPANAIMSSTFQLGNSSNVRKRVTVLMHDRYFADLTACTFWLPAFASLQTYTMRAYASQAWTDASLSVYPSTIGAEQWIRLDTVSMQSTPSVTIQGTSCVEPGGGS